jgi:hypothetical protein
MAVLAGATSHTSTTTGIVAAVFLFVFNSFFAIGWLGMTWLYPGKQHLLQHLVEHADYL